MRVAPARADRNPVHRRGRSGSHCHPAQGSLNGVLTLVAPFASGRLVLRAGIASVIVAGVIVVVGAQSPPAFTVASVRPSAPGERGMFASDRPGGGFSARNATV